MSSDSELLKECILENEAMKEQVLKALDALYVGLSNVETDSIAFAHIEMSIRLLETAVGD